MHQITKIAKANTRTAITDNFRHESDCKLAPMPTAEIVTEPQHGKVSFVAQQEKLSSKKLNAKVFRCEGALVNILYIYYTPKRAYRGPDQFTVRWTTGSNQPTKTYSFVVE
jgi:hypothetical protein